MKTAITTKRAIYVLLAFLGMAGITSCVKEVGHFISVSTVKSATMQFYVQGDTTHTMATTVDTISFVSVATPQTTVIGKNGQRPINCTLVFNANTKGTFSLVSLSLKYKQKSGTTLTTSNSNYGTVTVDSINATKGYISGSFVSKVLVATADTANVVGTFSIQQ